MSSIVGELDRWLDAHWDPTLTVRAWWELFGDAGWAAPGLPSGRYGRDASPDDAAAIAARCRDRGVLPAPGGAGSSVVAPTLAAHLADDEIGSLLRSTVAGR